MIPEESTNNLRNIICKKNVGIIGNYTHCTTSTKCIGTFKPNKDTNSYIGENNKLEFVNEEKLEFICDIKNAKNIITKIKEIHPYEEPVIDIIPLIDESSLM